MLIDKTYITPSDDSTLLNTVFSNVDNVNAYFEQHLHSDEILPAVLYSYYAEYYRSQVLAGGVAQFAHQSRWQGEILHFVEHALHEIGASEHLALLDKIADKILHQIGVDNFMAFTEQAFDNTHPIAQALSVFTDEFIQINHTENLAKLNHDYLQQHLALVIIDEKDFKNLLKELDNQPTLQQRQQQFLAELLLHEQQIRQLCTIYGCELLHIFDKEKADDGWHFFTSRGRFFLQQSSPQNGNEINMMTYVNPTAVATLEV